MNLNIETNRLILQLINSSHLEMYYDFLIRNAEFFRKWSPKYEDGYFDKEYHRARMEKNENETRYGNLYKFATFIKDKPECIIGTISFSNIIYGPFQSCFLGYRFDEKNTGQGFAAESIKHCIDFMFNEIKLHRIEANIVPFNYALIRVAERLGFKLEGSSKNYLQINGKWEDHLHYVLLNDNIFP